MSIKAGRRAAATLAIAVAVAAGATVVFRPSVAQAVVEYVKICSQFGAMFHYVPGTDICLNAVTNDARQFDTKADLTWRWRMPSNPHKFVKAPKKACKGELIEFGEITSSGLTLNAHGRYETTTRLPFELDPEMVVASVIFQGGFNYEQPPPPAPAVRGDFCMFYYHDEPIGGPTYTSIGCLDTTPHAAAGATAVFVPDSPVPPTTGEDLFLVGANGERWDVESAAEIEGSLSIWVCLEKAS